MAEPAPDEPEGPDEPSRYGGLIGVIFVIVLALGAMYLVERMRHYASLGDCAFTHAPACRDLIGH